MSPSIVLPLELSATSPHFSLQWFGVCVCVCDMLLQISLPAAKRYLPAIKVFFFHPVAGAKCANSRSERRSKGWNGSVALQQEGEEFMRVNSESLLIRLYFSCVPHWIFL